MIIRFSYWKPAHRKCKLWKRKASFENNENHKFGSIVQRCIRAGLLSCKSSRKKIYELLELCSWLLSSAWRDRMGWRAVPACAEKCLPWEKPAKNGVCVWCGLGGFCWSLRAAVFGKSSGAACQRLLLMREESQPCFLCQFRENWTRKRRLE